MIFGLKNGGLNKAMPFQESPTGIKRWSEREILYALYIHHACFKGERIRFLLTPRAFPYHCSFEI